MAELPKSLVDGLWRSLVAHLTGGQGVASSNLASPTVKVLVRVGLPDSGTAPRGRESGTVSGTFQDPPARAAPRALAADPTPASDFLR